MITFVTRYLDTYHEENKNRMMNLEQAKHYLIKGLSLLKQPSSSSSSAAVEACNNLSQTRTLGSVTLLQTEKDDCELTVIDELTELQFDVLEETTWILLAFVYLELSDPFQSLLISNSLLSRSTLSDQHRFIVELYHTESLCLTGRLIEATTYLETEFSSQELFGYSSLSRTLGYNTLSDTETVDVLVMVNRAINLTHLGRFNDARSFLEIALKHVPQCSSVIKNLVFILLKIGLPSQALRILREARGRKELKLASCLVMVPS
jgi:tetratricopeptide (TPR) repeat protein